MSEDEEIEALRKKKMMELQQRLATEQQRVQAQQQIEMQKKALLRRILSPQARQRLTNLRIVKPEFAAQIELQLIQLAQTGRLSIPVTDDQLKEILARLQSQRRDIKIRRK
ncbi:MAG: DNA-binding protein [Candidatus Bathyarchaeota archaeon]|nr:MAG: DNA-binding protein [Candidatus Bathyarchaeota archaeon]